MDGLISYADILGSWVYHLQGLWAFLNTTVSSAFTDIIVNISKTNPLSPSVGFLVLTRGFINLLGFGDLTVLMFFFTCMGYGFGVFFCFQIFKWLLDLII